MCSSTSGSSCPTPRAGGSRCRSRRCPACGVLWAGDTRKRILVNVTAYAGSVALVTITAPGSDRLPDREAMRSWNLSAPRRWRQLHRAAARRARRKHGRFTLVTWTWEYQRRGALHKHLVLGLETAAELAAAHTYVQALNDLRHAYGFGFVDRGRRHNGTRRLERVPADRAGRYIAKYLSPLDAAGKPTLSETVTRQDVPPLVAYVSNTLTAQTGCTMRWLRWVRHAYVLRIDPSTGELTPRHPAYVAPVATLQAGPSHPAHGPPSAS